MDDRPYLWNYSPCLWTFDYDNGDKVNEDVHRSMDSVPIRGKCPPMAMYGGENGNLATQRRGKS